MFTGIISDIGTITQAEKEPGGDLRVTIASRYKAGDIALGESIAVNGVCLTVVNREPAPDGSFLSFTLSQETLSRTAPRWLPQTVVNLERSLRVGDRLSGHFVTGHVDGLARIEEMTPADSSHILVLTAPRELSRFVAEKGSVALNGVSLTVNRVEGNRFDICIIPHTWEHTTLSESLPGDSLNMEIDLLARYVARLAEAA